MATAGRLPFCLATVLLLGSQAYAQPAAPMQPCQVADDPDYGSSPARPAQVGGGPMYGAARQQRYLKALRGPGGEPVTFERKGTAGSPDTGLVDRYDVRYEGAVAPVVVYVDFYHFTDTLLAPRGLTCGGEFDLGMPPPDPFIAEEQLRELALAGAAERGFSAPPMELGTPPALMIVDHFRRLSVAARAAARRKAPLTAAALPRELASPQTTVIVYPQACGDRTNAPASVGLSDRSGRTISPASTTSEPGAIRDLTGGVVVPAGSLAATFPTPLIQPGLAVTVRYGEPACAGMPSKEAYEVTGTGAQLLESAMPKRPAGDAAIGRWVALQAVIDDIGGFRVVRPLGGPPELSQAALEAVATWRALPARIAGHPVPTPVVLQVRFEPSESPR